MSDTKPFSPEKKPNSGEEQNLWNKHLPRKYLSGEIVWNDDDFMPKDAKKEYIDVFRECYGLYFRQICDTDGFDIDIYPGAAKAAIYIPYLEFEKEADMLMELANHAIDDYNNVETNVHKYKVSSIEKVNYISGESCREFFITIKVDNLTLRTPLQTFQIHAYKGPHGENVVVLCRRVQNLDVVGSEPPSSAEKKQKQEGSVISTSSENSKNGADPPPEKSKNGSEPSLSSPGKKIQNRTEDFNYFSLTPNDEGYAEFFYHELEGNNEYDEILLEGASKEQRPDFVKLFVDYDRQMYNSDGFDCYDYPCGDCLGTGIVPLQNLDAQNIEKIMELANHAIQEYNEKECNVFKYKALKIEKVNFQLTSYFQYYMTVKVLNITLGSLIETFQIRAARDMINSDVKIVYSCKPKVKVAPGC